MKKSTFILLAVLLSLIAIRVETQTLVNYGESNTSLSTSLTTAVSGSSFSIPSTYAYIVTWTVLSDGSAESSILEGSMDNSAWNTIDTQTGATGGSKNFGFTGYRFLRVSQVSRTGGTTTSGTFSVARGFINSSSGANLSSLALTGPLSLPDGSAAAPSLTFSSDSTTGLSKSASGKLTLSGTTPTLQFGGITSSFPSLKQSGAALHVRLADDSAFGSFIASSLQYTSTLVAATSLLFANAPTISSGFGTSPSVVNSNGTASFSINVGTGGVATSGVIGLPTAANGWNCHINDITTTNSTVFITKQTATTTTTATIGNFTTTGVAGAWVASDILSVNCFAR